MTVHSKIEDLVFGDMNGPIAYFGPAPARARPIEEAPRSRTMGSARLRDLFRQRSHHAVGDFSPSK